MRTLIIQEAGRHEENKNYRESLCMQRALKLLGEEADVWGLNHESFKETPEFNSYDLIINLENYDETGWLPDLSLYNKPVKFLWSIDAHCRGIEPYMKIFHAGKYDKILQAIKDFVNEHSVWFPSAYDHTLMKPLGIEKKYKLGFCGSVLNRGGLLDLLTEKYNLKKDIWVLGDDMVRAVNSYKIHFNMNIANDINFRSFETIGMGTVLLTNRNPQYYELGFIDGINCLMYETPQELCSKIETFSKNDKVLDMIGKMGLDLARKHTYLARAKKIINLYKNAEK